jgi:hypothetical protein
MASDPEISYGTGAATVQVTLPDAWRLCTNQQKGAASKQDFITINATALSCRVSTYE